MPGPTHRIILSPLALSNIEEIHAGIASTNPLNASRFVQKIRDQIDGLGEFPDRFSLAPEAKHFAEPLHHVTVWPYRIVYRVKAGTVEIITIRHGARRSMKPVVGGQGRTGYPPATR